MSTARLELNLLVMTSERPRLHFCVTFWHQLTPVCLHTVTCRHPHPPRQHYHAEHVLLGPVWNMHFTRTARRQRLHVDACISHFYFAFCIRQIMSDMTRMSLLFSWKQTGVNWHLTWLEFLCFNISKRCKRRCVLRGPCCPHSSNLRSQESPPLQILWSESGCEVFRFSEAVNKDGCSRGCFSHFTQTVRLSLEHPQESFFFLFTC